MSSSQPPSNFGHHPASEQDNDLTLAPLQIPEASSAAPKPTLPSLHELPMPIEPIVSQLSSNDPRIRWGSSGRPWGSSSISSVPQQPLLRNPTTGHLSILPPPPGLGAEIALRGSREELGEFLENMAQVYSRINERLGSLEQVLGTTKKDAERLKKGVKALLGSMGCTPPRPHGENNMPSDTMKMTEQGADIRALVHDLHQAMQIVQHYVHQHGSILAKITPQGAQDLLDKVEAFQADLKKNTKACSEAMKVQTKKADRRACNLEGRMDTMDVNCNILKDNAQELHNISQLRFHELGSQIDKLKEQVAKRDLSIHQLKDETENLRERDAILREQLKEQVKKRDLSIEELNNEAKHLHARDAFLREQLKSQESSIQQLRAEFLSQITAEAGLEAMRGHGRVTGTSTSPSTTGPETTSRNEGLQQDLPDTTDSNPDVTQPAVATLAVNPGGTSSPSARGKVGAVWNIQTRRRTRYQKAVPEEQSIPATRTARAARAHKRAKSSA